MIAMIIFVFFLFITVLIINDLKLFENQIIEIVKIEFMNEETEDLSISRFATIDSSQIGRPIVAIGIKQFNDVQMYFGLEFDL
jgi:hypothetical protein